MNTTGRIQQAAELAAVIQYEAFLNGKADISNPVTSAYQAVGLIGYANRLHRYYETDCNYGLDEKQHRAVDKIQAKARYLAVAAGLVVDHFNGDPRGWSIKFKLRSGRFNDMGGETWGI